MKTYKKIIRMICTVFEIVAAVSLGAMVVVVSIHIIMRYFFHNAPGWGEEMARQFMILFCFIAMALGVRDKLHIALTIVADRVLKNFRLPLEILGKVLIFVLGIMMSSFMGPYFTKLKFNRLPGTGIPVGYQYVFPTMVGVLMSLIAVYQIYDHFKYGTDEEQRKKEERLKETSS
ncbi:MAG: TRAP transporter small permease [Treponema sp.]|jgi:TRAP-type C4-dicarboxylate transport system permease small subunit|nr:TRAP transporter small permease [Treponema sp.]